MAIMLPPMLDTTLELAGLWFPNINEDEIHADAQAARVVQAGTTLAGAEADATVRGTSAVYRGESATEMQRSWQANDSNSGHLAQASSAMKVAPVALDGLGTVVTATKVAVGTIAAVGTVRLVYSALAGGPTAGLAQSLVLLAVRRAGTKVFRQAAEGSGRHLATGLRTLATRRLHEIMERLRPPGGPGGTALAGVGHGPGRMPLSTGKNAFDRSPGILQRGGRGGRGGGRGGSTEGQANLNQAEQAALEAKQKGQPYDQKAAKAAESKQNKAQKFLGTRNAQKRANNKRK
ncbi:hypothetical protein [Nonomuraea helvata]|uniref:Uncharacterized protein n=1 Tax=Nonomuraea helvata TaxID=37484 RepID=A0ABV5S5U4_9ACTN